MKKKILKFGDQVYKNRKSRGMSQQELAGILCVSTSTICRIENATRKNLSYSLVFKLRRVLEITEPEEGFVF